MSFVSLKLHFFTAEYLMLILSNMSIFALWHLCCVLPLQVLYIISSIIYYLLNIFNFSSWHYLKCVCASIVWMCVVFLRCLITVSRHYSKYNWMTKPVLKWQLYHKLNPWWKLFWALICIPWICLFYSCIYYTVSFSLVWWTSGACSKERPPSLHFFLKIVMVIPSYLSHLTYGISLSYFFKNLWGGWLVWHWKICTIICI